MATTPISPKLASPVPILRPALKYPSRPTSPRPPTPQLGVASPSTLQPSVPQITPSTTPGILSGGGGDGPRSGLALTPGGPASAGGGYTQKVSFDTFAAPSDTDSMFSFTLQVKSEGFRKTRNTRVYLVAASSDESGMQALEWAIANLIEDGDELVVVRGFDCDDLHRDMHDQIREEAKDLMKLILDRNTDFEGRRLSVVVEFVAGKITETIDRMTALYRPDSLVVGTRGSRGLMQSWGAALGAPGVGSVSRYCVSHSPVPVIVIRPERKVKKAMEKRRADPKRRAQFEELTKTKSLSGIGLAG